MPAQIIDIGEWKKKNMPQTTEPTPPPAPELMQGNDMSALVRSLFKDKNLQSTS